MTPEQEQQCQAAFDAKFPCDFLHEASGFYLSQRRIEYICFKAGWSAAQAQQWLPIESAPLCKGRGRELNSVIVGRFPYHGRHYPAALARKTNKGWVIGKGEKLWFEPTHYQPLPTPLEQHTSGEPCQRGTGLVSTVPPPSKPITSIVATASPTMIARGVLTAKPTSGQEGGQG